jgi:hypothetical protein
MAKTFAVALREQAVARGGLRARRLIKFLDSPSSSAKARRLRRMEDRVAGHIGLAAPKIDWSTVDWGALFDKILELLLKILPLFLGK